MSRTAALIIAAMLALVITLSLARGDAENGAGISRKDEPLVYWGIVGGATIALVAMLLEAWRA